MYYFSCKSCRFSDGCSDLPLIYEVWESNKFSSGRSDTKLARFFNLRDAMAFTDYLCTVRGDCACVYVDNVEIY